MIAIIIAMYAEGEKIIDQLTRVENPHFELYQGLINDVQLTLCLCGIGKANAAMATTYICDNIKPKLIINLGFAGGYLLDYGQSYLVEKATYHDFDLSIFGYEVGQVPKLNKWLLPYALTDRLDYEETILYTGDHFQQDPITNTPYMCDMEGNAILQVANRFGIDVISIKTISDDIGHHQQFDNYKISEASFAEKIYENLLEILKICCAEASDD